MPYVTRLAVDDPAARAAGRSVSVAHRHLREFYAQVAELLVAADDLFGGDDDPWFCDHGRAVWRTATDLEHARDWVPSRVVRFWRQPAAREWSRAVAVHLFIDDDAAEPRLGCFSLAPRGDAPLAVWSPTWCDAEAYDARWLPDREGRAFDWSEPRQPDVPVRACGYYLRVTDVASAEDLAALVVEPLRAIARRFDAAALPSPLP